MAPQLMLFDAHTHFFSFEFFRALAAQSLLARGESADETAIRTTLEALAAKTGIELPPQDLERHRRSWIEELDCDDVDRAVTFASVPSETSDVLTACSASDGRLVPYLTCDAASAAGIERAVEGLRSGARGVLLFPAIHRVDVSDRALDPLLEEASARRAPVVVHCGILAIKLRDLLGVRPAYDIRFASPLSVSAAAERHRGVTFVIPHFGGGFFRETLLAGAQSPNVFVDTSSSNSWRAAHGTPLELADVFARTLAVFGPERVLFGTDSSTRPRGWRRDLLDEQLAALEKIGTDASTRGRILGENLAELLGR